MLYDGTSKLGDAIAALYGCSPGSHNKIAELTKEAKAGLGITSKAKPLPDDVNVAIYRWLSERLNPVQDVKQVGTHENNAAQSVADSVIGTIPPTAEPEALLPVSLVQDIKQTIQPLADSTDEAAKPSDGAGILLPGDAVQDVKQDALSTDGGTGPDDYEQVHFALTVMYGEQAKRTTVMLEGYLVKALQRKHRLSDNTAIRVWIEQAIKADGSQFDSHSPLTKQVKRIIVESFV